MKVRLVLIRGLPSSGKTTAAEKLNHDEWYSVLSADDYFTGMNGEYNFRPEEIADAHQECIQGCRELLQFGADVIVNNTMTQRWEMEPYLCIARELNIEFEVVDLFDGGLTDQELAQRNTHGVPVETITAMRAQYEHDWRAGDVRPPWER